MGRVVPSPEAYVASIGVAAVGCAGVCVAARKWPGPWVLGVARGLGVLLLATMVSRLVEPAMAGHWSAGSDLPLFICTATGWIAPAAFWLQVPLLYELTYFWGLAGGALALATPTVSAPFPQLAFMQYVVLHTGVVVAAFITVIALAVYPRPGAVRRVFMCTCLLTLLAAFVNIGSGGNYMYLRRPPSNATLLTALGPWPWYIVSSTAIALVVFWAMDAPFRHTATAPPLVRH